MRVIRSIKEMQKISSFLRKKGDMVGFVPTMGALHAGHVSLMQKSKKNNDITVVSIFVNPKQFGPREDLKKYPRTFARDLSVCRKEKIDFVFYPHAQDIYPKGHKTYVEVEGLSDVLCGLVRPGHFRGVTTVVTKLFNIVAPCNAYFGQKDAQQALIIKRMTLDLNMPVKINIAPTIRDKDGLALSSRNIYLSPAQRQDALVIPYSLKVASAIIKNGIRKADEIIAIISKLIKQRKSAKIQYVKIVDPLDLQPVNRVTNGSLIALAVYIGKTRLIDNIIVRI